MIKKQFHISFLAILSCLLWSTAFAGVKIGLQYVSPLFFAGIRFILAGIMLLPFCGNITLFINNLRHNFKLIFLICIFQTFLLYGAFFLGMNLVQGAVGAMIIGVSPLITLLMTHFHMKDDKIDLSKMLSILIGMIGVVTISLSTKPWISGGFSQLLGILILLCGSVCSAIGNILIAKDKKDINPIHLNAAQIFLGGILLFVISIFFEKNGTFALPLRFYAVLFWLAFISATAFSLWFMLLKLPETKVSELNMWKFIIPVFGAILSWIILPGESPSLLLVIGMLFIVLALLHSNYRMLNSTTHKSNILNNIQE